MSITSEQKAFIRKVAPGIRIYMAAGDRAVKISENPKNEIERFIKKNLLNHEKNEVRTTRLWFCESTFCQAVDTLIDEKLKDLLYYFDAHDMPLCDVYVESRLCPSDLSETEIRWGERLMDGSIVTFEKFLS